MAFLAWALPILGATLIITCSTLLRPLRDALRRFPFLHELIQCPMCTGFWVGFSASLLGLSFIPEPWQSLAFLRAPSEWIAPLQRALVTFGDACAGAWMCWTAHVVLCHLGQGKLLSTRPDLHDKPRAELPHGHLVHPKDLPFNFDPLFEQVRVSSSTARIERELRAQDPLGDIPTLEHDRNTTIPAPTRTQSTHCDNCGHLFTESRPRANTLGGWDVCVPCVKEQGVGVRNTGGE